MSKHRSLAMPVLLSLVLALVGCADDGAPTPPPDDGADDPSGPPIDDEDSPLGIATGRAIQHAADEAGVETSDIEVVSAEEVTWPDGAIGCPEPGQAYSQALVEGFRIILEVDGERVQYHAADPEDPFRCDDPQEPVQTN